MADTTKSRNFAAIIGLVLALLLVVGVLVGSKTIDFRANHQPVALTDLGLADAASEACTQVVAALPDQVLGLDRTPLADPAPAGAAVWQHDPNRRITFRCGVAVPAQYTTLTETTTLAGAKWILVADQTPGSTLKTWYTVDTKPAIAVTADDSSLNGQEQPVAEFAQALASLTKEEPTPAAAPLTELAAGSTERCNELIAQLPADTVAAPYQELAADAATKAGYPAETSKVWVAPGLEPVVVRCGVAAPANYQAGAQLQQINQQPWFVDTKLANNTTAATWFALGLPVNVAVSFPYAAGNGAITTISEQLTASYGPAAS